MLNSSRNYTNALAGCIALLLAWSGRLPRSFIQFCGQISGSATTTILYGEFGVEVPLTPSVAFVSGELQLDLAFVALSE